MCLLGARHICYRSQVEECELTRAWMLVWVLTSVWVSMLVWMLDLSEGLEID